MTARHARSEAIARSCTCSSSHSSAVIALRCSGRLSVSWRTCRLGWSMSSAEPTRGSYALRRSAARQDRPRSRPCRAPTPPGSPSRASSSDAAVPPPWSARARRLGEDAEVPWSELGGMDGVDFTAGDVAALQAARAARVLIASPRARDALGHGVRLDALVLSEHDAIERRAAQRARRDADLLVRTDGERGGSYRLHTGASGSWAAVPPPADPVDSYGCGDSFAA